MCTRSQETGESLGRRERNIDFKDRISESTTGGRFRVRQDHAHGDISLISSGPPMGATVLVFVRYKVLAAFSANFTVDKPVMFLNVNHTGCRFVMIASSSL